MNTQLLRALLVGVWFGFWHWSQPLTRCKNLFRVLWANRYAEEAPRSHIEQRNRCCEKCPLFYAQLSTCGSPLDPTLQGMGCWCHTPTKNRLLHTSCWLWDKTNGEEGWPTHLNA